MSMMDQVLRHNDLTNHIYGNLRVLHRVPANESGHAMWMCRCMCGAHKIASYSNLKSGKNKSCGNSPEHKRLMSARLSPMEKRMELIRKCHLKRMRLSVS